MKLFGWWVVRTQVDGPDLEYLDGPFKNRDDAMAIGDALYHQELSRPRRKPIGDVRTLYLGVPVAEEIG